MSYSPFEKRKRWAARFALYSSLVLVLLGLAGLGALGLRIARPEHQGVWEEEDYLKLPEVLRLRDYVRIDTSGETGSELEGARFLASILEEAGVEAHIERLGDKRANLWAILEGEDPEALVLHHHIDVSPIVDPDGWDFDPFAAELELPWLYGRGVFDMKSVAIAQLQAFLALAEEGPPLKRSLILLATSSEETGSELGSRRIVSQHPELVDRFWAVLTEGGVVEAVSRNEIKYWGIEFAQKRLMPMRACSSSRQRLEDLRADLLAVAERGLEDDPEIPPELRQFAERYGPTRGSTYNRRRLADLDALLLNGWAWHRLPSYLRAIFIDEAFPRDVEETAEGQYELPINILLRLGSDGTQVEEELLLPWAHGVELAASPPLGSERGSPVDHPLYRAAEHAVAETYPEAVVGPYVLSWSVTDARFFRQAGVPSYGFSPFLIVTSDTLQVDQVNERLSIPGFVEGVALYERLVRDLVAE